MSAVQSVAVNLQNWRRRRGLSVSALARAAGVSKSTVSELERHNGNPSLDTLWSLAGALDIPLGFLFNDDEHGTVMRVVRDDDAAVTLEEPGYLARLLAGWRVSGEVEIYMLAIDEGVRRESGSHGFDVVEHAIPIEGRIDIGVAGESAEIGPGDLITFPADRPHHYQAIGGPAKVVSIHQYSRGRSDTTSAPDAAPARNGDGD